MSSQISNSVSTSLLQRLQTTEQARTGSSIGHLMTAAAGWIRRGFEFAQSHPEITPIVLAAPTVIIATRTALSYFSTATDPTEEEDQELPEEVFEELSMAADALEEPIVNPTRAPATALIEELDGVLNSALQEQQAGSDREEDRPSPSADLTRTATASPLRVEAGRYIAILCKEGQTSPFEQGENCAICQDDTPEDIVGHPTPSSRGAEHHKFHKVCIAQWSRTREYSSYFTNELDEIVEVPVPVGSRGCPLCKEPIVSIEGQEAEVAPAPTLTSSNEDLRIAARDGRLEVVQALIDAGANLNQQDDNGGTALHLAAENGRLEVVQALINAGVDLDAPDRDGRTALYLAAENGRLEVVQALIAARANLNHQDVNGSTALRLAASYGRLQVVQALSDAGADLNAPDRDGRTVLQTVALYARLEVVQALIAAGADLNASGPNGWTTLHLAALNGHVEVVQALIAAGADLNASGPNGRTALYLAAKNGRLEIVQALIAAGADLNASGPNGFTALHWAAFNGHLEVVKSLIDAGADLSILESFGRTALPLAAFNGHLEIINTLLAAGADLSVTDSYGWTALHTAAFRGHWKIINALLAAGAELAIPDHNGFTALHCAALMGHLEAVQALTAALEAERATQTEQDSVEKSTLQLEAESEYFDVGSALRTAGAII